MMLPDQHRGAGVHRRRSLRPTNLSGAVYDRPVFMLLSIAMVAIGAGLVQESPVLGIAAWCGAAKLAQLHDSNQSAEELALGCFFLIGLAGMAAGVLLFLIRAVLLL